MPPQYIFWYHNDRMVNYDVERGVKVTTLFDSTRTESKLTFANANKRDEGNYTSPSNSTPDTVQLFVTRSKPLTAESMPCIDNFYLLGEHFTNSPNHLLEAN